MPSGSWKLTAFYTLVVMAMATGITGLALNPLSHRTTPAVMLILTALLLCAGAIWLYWSWAKNLD